jgi:hypothetical protein
MEICSKLHSSNKFVRKMFWTNQMHNSPIRTGRKWVPRSMRNFTLLPCIKQYLYTCCSPAFAGGYCKEILSHPIPNTPFTYNHGIISLRGEVWVYKTLCCLFFFDIRILIALLVSTNSSLRGGSVGPSCTHVVARPIRGGRCRERLSHPIHNTPFACNDSIVSLRGEVLVLLVHM